MHVGYFFIHSLTKRKPAILKCARRFFIHTSSKRKKKKKSTVNCYNLISNHFHAKLMGKQLRNEAKFKFKNKRPWLNVYSTPSCHLGKNPKCPNTGSSNCFHLSSIIAVLMCFSSFYFKRYRRHVVYNDVMRDSVMCSLTLRHVTENRYVKYQCTFSAGTFFFYWAMNKMF